MANEMRCPSCGNAGEASTDESGAFEVRGQFQGRAIRKCKKCGVGLALGPFSGGLFGKPKVIPEEQWQRMEAVWQREFGNE
jgi:hypothetical protein